MTIADVPLPYSILPTVIVANPVPTWETLNMNEHLWWCTTLGLTAPKQTWIIWYRHAWNHNWRHLCSMSTRVQATIIHPRSVSPLPWRQCHDNLSLGTGLPVVVRKKKKDKKKRFVKTDKMRLWRMDETTVSMVSTPRSPPNDPRAPASRAQTLPQTPPWSSRPLQQ